MAYFRIENVDGKLMRAIQKKARAQRRSVSEVGAEMLARGLRLSQLAEATQDTRSFRVQRVRAAPE
jgi:hypothetical protein